jgi:hypothetical protein
MIRRAEKNNMEDNITIIEGPPPTFESLNEQWALSLNETPNLSNVVFTRLRTFNGPALVERCHRAWRSRNNIELEYRGEDGLVYTVPILAARALEVDEGQMLVLWVRMDIEEAELLAGFDDDFGDDIDDDLDFPGL